MKIDEGIQAVAAVLYHDAALALESVEALLGSIPKGNIGSKTCVIVDAEVDAAEALAEYLVARGIRVWTTSSGEEALRVIRQVRPTLVLADLKPQGIGGIPLLVRIRRFSPRSRIVILTGWGAEYLDDFVRTFQVDACCLKPATVATVQKIINETLAGMSLFMHDGYESP
jgi:DNA-binding response OmpR family regulator